MSTPLCDALRDYAGGQPARFHMPGHKGIFSPVPELSGAVPLDVTELSVTGDLYEAGSPFDRAQALWAERFGFSHCQLLTGGSTMGIHTGLSLFCRPGDRVLVDRNCHRAVFNAMALLDLRPVYLERPWLSRESVAGPVSPQAVENALENCPDIKTVCITSPTYAGVLSETEAISRIVHARGGKLFVDGAHGAHLPFLGVDSFRGADGVAVSAHKTLPALGQGAMLFTDGVAPARVRRAAAVFGTSSPSYLILASMDGVRAWLEGEGGPAYAETARRVARLRERFPALDGGPALDPARLTLLTKDGPALTARLEKEGIWPEMADRGHVVLICTPQDLEGNLARLESALERNRELLGPCPPIPAPPLPQQAVPPRAALFAPAERLPLGDCAGRVAACQLAPYPPGVPVVAPGERIGKKELSYLQEIGYNSQEVWVVAEG